MAALFSEKLIGLAWAGIWEDKEDWGTAVIICITLVVRNPRQDQASTMLDVVHSHRIGKGVAWKRKLKQTKGERGNRYKDMKYHAQEHTASHWPRNRKFLSCQLASGRAALNCSEAVRRKRLYVRLHLGKALGDNTPFIHILYVLYTWCKTEMQAESFFYHPFPSTLSKIAHIENIGTFHFKGRHIRL